MTTTTITRPISNGLTLILWLVANVFGFGLVAAMFHNFPLALTFPPNLARLGSFRLMPALLGGLLFGFVPALLIGFLQRSILRHHLPLSRWWIISVSAGMGLMHFLSDGFESARDLSLAVLISGTLVGLGQWRLVRHQPQAIWLIPINAASWYVGWVFSITLLDALGLLHLSWVGGLDFKQHGLQGAVVGLTAGLSTGLFWMQLLRHEQKE